MTHQDEAHGAHESIVVRGAVYLHQIKQFCDSRCKEGSNAIVGVVR